jgi:hypothetical protein
MDVWEVTLPGIRHAHIPVESSSLNGEWSSTGSGHVEVAKAEQCPEFGLHRVFFLDTLRRELFTLPLRLVVAVACRGRGGRAPEARVLEQQIERHVKVGKIHRRLRLQQRLIDSVLIDTGRRLGDVAVLGGLFAFVGTRLALCPALLVGVGARAVLLAESVERSVALPRALVRADLAGVPTLEVTRRRRSRYRCAPRRTRTGDHAERERCLERTHNHGILLGGCWVGGLNWRMILLHQLVFAFQRSERKGKKK